MKANLLLKFGVIIASILICCGQFADAQIQNCSEPASPSFAAPISLADSHIQTEAVLFLADVDGDSLRDVVAVSLQNIVIFKNNGKRRFSTASVAPFTVPQNTSISYIQLEDINGDSRPDLVLYSMYNLQSTLGRFILVYPGTGSVNAPFGSPATFQVPAGSSGLEDGSVGYTQIAINDFTGDGIKDIAVPVNTSLMQNLVVLKGLGNGNFKAGTPSPFSGWACTSADFDGNGTIDIALGGGFGPASDVGYILFNSGDGTFHFGRSFGGPYVGDFKKLNTNDINSDGRPDITTMSTIRFTEYLNTGSGQMNQSYMSYGMWANCLSTTYGQLDRVGYLDLVSVNGWSRLVSLSRANRNISEIGDQLNATVLSDLDKDGLHDIGGVSPGGGTVKVIFNNTPCSTGSASEY